MSEQELRARAAERPRRRSGGAVLSPARPQNLPLSRRPLSRRPARRSPNRTSHRSPSARAPPKLLRQYELIERVKAYDPTADEALLNRAYVYAMRVHGSQTRASGDPYFAHPIEVAGILTDYRLDTATIVTALLHDVIEDTADHPRRRSSAVFGAEIAELVEGVTKLSRLELTAEHTRQAENLRKFILAISKDVRVLMVKLADRLHNMRTLNFIAERGQARAHRPRDAGHLRAAGPLDRLPPHLHRAGRAGLPAPEPDRPRRDRPPAGRHCAPARARRWRWSADEITAKLNGAGPDRPGRRPREAPLFDLAQAAAQVDRLLASCPTSTPSG